MKIKHVLLFALTLSSLLNTCFSQSIQQEKMKELSFLVGEWVGTSKTFENGKLVKEIPAFEKISYDLDSSIIVLELNSAALQLHTIIYFNQDEDTYYYPFSKRGVYPAKASFENGKLIVQSKPKKRFIFGLNEEGGFREYGEKLIDDEWVLYFQDDFVNTK